MKTAIGLIEQRVKFEMDIVQMDSNNGVQMSMSVFQGILKKILIQVEQSKEMEKQQIIEAVYFGHLKGWVDGWVDDGFENSYGEHYYYETFKSE